MKTIIALSPHADDVELGCGALLAQLMLLVPSLCPTIYVYSTSTDVDPRAPNEEWQNALTVLHVVGEHLGYRDMTLWRYRDRILDHLIYLRDTFHPDLVLVPATYDSHQDHQVVTQEAIRAFKYSSILGYDLPWNTVMSSHITTFVPISELSLARKIVALACYKSQSTKPYFQPDVIRSLAVMQGIRCGSPLAEGFETIRWVLTPEG